jgi:nuclear pore complex protein Nup133
VSLAGYSLQIILEHGEKLAGMIQLRELQNVIGQNHSTGVGSSHSSAESQMSGAVWDLIQLVGERARRNTVLLMDRDNAEVFYSKVSELDEVFYCLDRHLDYVISTEQPLWIQIQRACELSKACVTILHEAMHYRNENHLWYPPPEGLTPWYCHPLVRSGLWSIASFMLHLLNEGSGIETSAKSDLYTHLEVLTEVLLEAYAGAVTAKVERGEEHRGLLDEFWNRRDTLLDSLYQQVQDFVDGRHQVNILAFARCHHFLLLIMYTPLKCLFLQDLNEGFEEQKEEILRKLSSHLLSIAKRHECYRALWRICCDLNDSVLLRNLMVWIWLF